MLEFKKLRLILASLLAVGISGCGLIFGGSQKVDNKSDEYKVYRLDQETSGYWNIISTGTKPVKDKALAAASEQEPEQADYAFEHKAHGAVASLNSVCRPQRNETLEDLTKALTMGLPDIKTISKKQTELDGAPAFDCTVETTEEGKPPIRIRTVVLRKTGCTYDFMYIARASVFDQNVADFERFLKGFHAP